MALNKKLSMSFNRVFSSAVWVLKIYWKMSPFHTFFAVTTSIAIEMASIINTFILAKGIDILLSVSRNESEPSSLYVVAFLFFVLAVAQQGLGILSNYSNRLLGLMFYPKFAEFTYKKANKLGIKTLENPEINNLIERTRRESGRVERMFSDVISLFGVVSSVVASGIIIIGFAPHFIPIFVVTLIPAVLLDKHYLSKLWKYNRDITEDRRKAYDSGHYLVDAQSLQELRITGGSRYLSKQFEDFVEGWLEKMKKIRGAWFGYMFGMRIVRSGVEMYADFYVFLKFIQNAISIGDVTFYIRQVSNFMSSLGSLGNSINNIYEGSLTIEETMQFFRSEEEEDGNEGFEKLTEGPEIKFEGVSFSYPGSARIVIKNLNLEVKKGEKVAIVGHNGAGKTTLVKLLLRFYKPQSGKVWVEGRDLQSLKIKEYYKNVSVLFQDFNAYPNLTVRENITIGKPEVKSSFEMKRAAEYADVSDFVRDYKDGFDQLLSEKYKGGTRPSTGQWQKIAIARFFYRNSPLVIFDEPTAAIDAKSEAKIFNKIYGFFKNKTVIIISHRFSTVRNADRIIVVSKGSIIEQGSHEELMKLNGKYAEAFELQAEGYKT